MVLQICTLWLCRHRIRNPQIFEQEGKTILVLELNSGGKAAVLWRILLTQALLYQAIKNCRSTDYEGIINDPDILNKMSLIKPKLFDWTHKKEEETDDQILQPLEAAENYSIDTLNQITDRAR